MNQKPPCFTPKCFGCSLRPWCANAAPGLSSLTPPLGSRVTATEVRSHRDYSPNPAYNPGYDMSRLDG